MKVLHIINGEHYAGAERVQDLLSVRLRGLGIECDFACLKLGDFASVRHDQSSVILDVSMRNRFDIGVIRRLVKIVRSGGYGIIHSHTPRAALIASMVSIICRVPYVHHLHSPTSRDSNRKLLNWINASVERMSVVMADAVVAVSESLKAYACALGVSEAKVTVVPNGVPILEGVSLWRAPRGCWTVGVVALFRPRKGMETLIDALSLLHMSGREIRVRAIGGFESEDYERSVKEYSNQLEVSHLIDWTGFTRDVYSELKEVNALVLPSLYGEGLPMALIEAMSLGLPVVGTRVEGVPEVLKNGINGFLAEPGSAHSLADALAQLMALGEEASQIATAGLETQRESYSDHAMARRLASVYAVFSGGSAND